MKVLITGNLGYVGPNVNKFVREFYKDAEIIGLDAGWFMSQTTGVQRSNDTYIDKQIYKDVRDIDQKFLEDNNLEDLDAVIWLAAISNDKMCDIDEKMTKEINTDAVIKGAKLLKQNAEKFGKKFRFVFASSCSIYGDGAGIPMDENGVAGAIKETDKVNPLTAYAKSKLQTEIELKPLKSDNFIITCLRYATAFGASNRLRLDLMMNDFVAGAVLENKISVLSDGTPWRAIISTEDMARAASWGISRDIDNEGNFLIINAGANNWSYQVKDFANMTAEVLGQNGKEVEVEILNKVPPGASYRVNFDYFERVVDDKFLAKETFYTSTPKMVEVIENTKDIVGDYRSGKYMRYNTLIKLVQDGVMNKDFRFND